MTGRLLAICWTPRSHANNASISSDLPKIDALFQTKRWDPPAGDYQVRLHWAETWSGAFAVGKRVFDVLLENQVVADNLDVYASVGGDTALTQTFAVAVTDGQLNLGFAHEVDNPMICAIEILGG